MQPIEALNSSSEAECTLQLRALIPGQTSRIFQRLTKRLPADRNLPLLGTWICRFIQSPLAGACKIRPEQSPDENDLGSCGSP